MKKFTCSPRPRGPVGQGLNADPCDISSGRSFQARRSPVYKVFSGITRHCSHHHWPLQLLSVIVDCRFKEVMETLHEGESCPAIADTSREIEGDRFRPARARNRLEMGSFRRKTCTQSLKAKTVRILQCMGCFFHSGCFLSIRKRSFTVWLAPLAVWSCYI